LLSGCGDFLKQFGSWLSNGENIFKLEDNGERSPLIIFYKLALWKRLLEVLRLALAAGWLRRFIHAVIVNRG
jgi:hypothetical protein